MNIIKTIGGVMATSHEVHAAQPTGVIFENVRIFNGTSDLLSAPSQVLVVDNVIKAISTVPIDDPPGTPVLRVPGGGTHVDAWFD